MLDPLDEVLEQLELVKQQKRRWKAIALSLAGVLGVIVLGFVVMLFGMQRRAHIERALASEAQQAADQAFRQAQELRDAKLRGRLDAERKAPEKRDQ
jgi:uncharacterized protein HemX